MTAPVSRVLVVDDNEEIHHDLRKILCRENSAVDQLEVEVFGGSVPQYEALAIDCAFQGREAYDLAQEALRAGRPYALAIVDVRMMPGWDGVETIERLWQVDPYLQVLICTAYTDHSWEEIVGRLGERDSLLILRKPFDAIEVLQAVHALVKKWQLHQQVRQRIDELERSVQHRTRELEQANAQLKREIADRVLAEDQLKHLATHDSLTTLPNRVLLRDRVAQCLARAKRSDLSVAVLLLDLDRFKEINDRLGHRAGDHVLQVVATRLARAIRECDTVARMGGDEFVVILGDLERSEEAHAATERILAAVAEPLTDEGLDTRVTASIGIALYPSDGTDIETLIKSADMAMYQAKRDGRGTARLCTSWITSRALERATLREQLGRAQAQNELEMWYQPLLALDDGTVTGVEALLRWQHPELGVLEPSKFIPIAEESGLIVPIGDWTIRAACDQSRRWQAAGMAPFPVAVNVSARQLRHPQLVDTVQQALAEARIDAACLNLELTESAVMEDIERSRATLVKLHESGVRIIIDDFGAGYSALSRLKELPIYALKIDRFFIHNIIDDDRDAAIVVAIMALAHSLNIRVIAEGIETRQQVERLRELRSRPLMEPRCDSIQGFFLGRPMPDREITALLNEKLGRSVTGHGLAQVAAGGAARAERE
ncbi:MAG: EAL domain-containing protein [Proteobacteria bacterium]|nr:EAL domain-containing protein [Pseudomonadota bacterium]